MLTATGLAPASTSGSALFAEPRLSFNTEDLHWGGRVGGERTWRGMPIALFADLEFRAFDRTVRAPITPTLSYQLKEARQVVGLGASASYPLLSRLHGAAGAGFGYTFADFRGTSRAPETGWVGWLEAGPRFVFSENFRLGAAYQWRPLPGVSSHRVTVGFGLRLPL